METTTQRLSVLLEKTVSEEAQMWKVFVPKNQIRYSLHSFSLCTN
uniref:Uncharacterized protein n=1 Tax=Callorhinchus milii TaxID=7868 RepID=A0A4W3I015_CALMI